MRRLVNAIALSAVVLIVALLDSPASVDTAPDPPSEPRQGHDSTQSRFPDAGKQAHPVLGGAFGGNAILLMGGLALSVSLALALRSIGAHPGPKTDTDSRSLLYACVVTLIPTAAALWYRRKYLHGRPAGVISVCTLFALLANFSAPRLTDLSYPSFCISLLIVLIMLLAQSGVIYKEYFQRYSLHRLSAADWVSAFAFWQLSTWGSFLGTRARDDGWQQLGSFALFAFSFGWMALFVCKASMAARTWLVNAIYGDSGQGPDTGRLWWSRYVNRVILASGDTSLTLAGLIALASAAILIQSNSSTLPTISRLPYYAALAVGILLVPLLPLRVVQHDEKP